MPTVNLPSLAVARTWESATAPLTAELTAELAAELTTLWASLATLCPALTTLEAALATELAGVVGVLLAQPDTTRASAAAPATADAILASLMR